MFNVFVAFRNLLNTNVFEKVLKSGFRRRSSSHTTEGTASDQPQLNLGNAGQVRAIFMCSMVGYLAAMVWVRRMLLII